MQLSQADTADTFGPPAILSIESTTVLGEFSYKVDFDTASHWSGRVVVIYAENGMGKTNFLKTVHHLLSPRLESLQALADLFVDDMTITLRNSAKISLLKASDADTLFECRIDYPTTASKDANHLIVRQEDIDARAFRRSTPRPDVARYLNELGNLVNPTVLVGDDRLIYAPVDNSSLRRVRSYDEERESLRRTPQPAQSVREALDRVERDFLQGTIRGISKDSAQAGEGVYVDITKRILEGSNQQILAAEARTSLLSQAEAVLRKAPDFEKYGLLSFAQVRRIVEMIEGTRANSGRLKSLQGILEPFLSSMADRVDSLAAVQKSIDTFVTSVNSFLERKTLHFTTTDGIKLRGKSHDDLEPDNLSSGEKHLLLLLSNAMMARSTGALVIIDEPELSLGLRWQRQLLAELLKCTENSGVQFLVASHSVQIMGDLDDVVRPTESTYNER